MVHRVFRKPSNSSSTALRCRPGTDNDGGNERRRQQVIQSFPISGGADAEVYDEKTGLIFVSTREGWIQIFHEDSPDHYSEASKVKTEFGAKTMAYDPKTDRILVDTADLGKAPEPTKEHPHPRPMPMSGTFHLLV